MSDVVQCPKCNRPNGLHRKTCIFCATPLPEPSVGSALASEEETVARLQQAMDPALMASLPEGLRSQFQPPASPASSPPRSPPKTRPASRKPGEESQIRAGLHLSGCLVTVEPAQLIELEKYMWELARREFEPPYFFRALPYSHAREFFFAFVVYVRGSLLERRDYLNHIKGIYHQLYTDLRNEFGAVMFRFRKYPEMLSYTGGYGSLLKEIKKSVDPNNIMNPGMLLFP